MAKSICEKARKRLDETLKCPTLVEKDNVRRLVRHQILKSPPANSPGGDQTRRDDQRKNNIEILEEKHSAEVWDTLEMLRSASDYDSEKSKTNGWKLKQDTDQLRVMYREGPQGAPFHTLLAEGYIDGPLDNCVCVGMESSLYSQWWPQLTLPTFKVTESRCLKRIRIGEELSLVRVKVPWPVSSREAVFRYFALEYFEEEIVLVLLKSVSDLQEIDESIHGFSNEDIPSAEGTVRMDLMGGFALQKVDSTQSYFRTIINLDIKLDFMPPSLINFISRQLIGHGFKLYQKTVLAASSSDENFRKIIETGPFYRRIREGLQSTDELKEENKYRSVCIIEVVNSEQEGESINRGKEAAGDSNVLATSNGASTSKLILSSEMQKDSRDESAVPKRELSFSAINSTDQTHTEKKAMGYVDPEIQTALDVLDNAIAFAQSHLPVARSSNQAKNSIPTSQNNLPTVTSEPILPKVSSDSFSDQLQNRNTEVLSLPQGKISETLHNIDGDGEVADNYYKQETNNSLANEISKMENHASRSAKVKSKKAYCFRFLRL